MPGRTHKTRGITPAEDRDDQAMPTRDVILVEAVRPGSKSAASREDQIGKAFRDFPLCQYAPSSFSASRTTFGRTSLGMNRLKCVCRPQRFTRQGRQHFLYALSGNPAQLTQNSSTNRRNESIRPLT